MRTPLEIYEHYQIPPWLQMHQLRVAAVGKVVGDSIAGADVRIIVPACLLHDMGAIVKFDFSYTGSDIERLYDGGNDIEHWIAVQKEFRTQYGEKEHEATDRILREIGLREEIRVLIGGSGLAKSQMILDSGSVHLRILEYADQRVGLHGVVPLVERLSDMKKRYSPRWGRDSYIEKEAQFDRSAAALIQLEGLLQKQSSIRFSDLTDESVAPIIEELKKYDVS